MNRKNKLIVATLVLGFTLSSFTLLKNNASENETESKKAVFGVFLKYYNKDSKSYEFKVKTCGSTTKVKFDGSKSSTVTIQTGCNDAIIYDKCREVKVESGDKITIKDGCIKID